MKQIEFTDQERKVVLEIINLAVKAGGLPVAGAADALARKFADPAEESSEDNVSELSEVAE